MTGIELKPPQPIDVVELFPEVLESLLDLLDGLTDEEWQKPTVCPGWTVRDVALHLLGVEIGNLSVRRDDFVTNTAHVEWEELVSRIDDENHLWVKATGRISPRLLTDLLAFSGAQMSAYFRKLDLKPLGGPVSWVGPEPVPVWLDVAREYTERWHHQQHIRDAVGKASLKEPRYLAPVLSASVWALPRTYRQVSPPDGTSITLTIRGGSGGQWSILREMGIWRLYQGSPDQPDATVVIDEEVAWRLFTGGVDRKEARRHVTVIGDQDLGLLALDAVAIIA